MSATGNRLNIFYKSNDTTLILIQLGTTLTHRCSLKNPAFQPENKQIFCFNVVEFFFCADLSPPLGPKCNGED